MSISAKPVAKKASKTPIKTRLMRRMFWFDQEDDAALATIMRAYRCQTKAQAVRLALSLIAAGQPSLKNPTPQPRKRHATKPIQKPHALTALAKMAAQTPLLDLPSDFAERLDDYLYGEMRAKL